MNIELLNKTVENELLTLDKLDNIMQENDYFSEWDIIGHETECINILESGCIFYTHKTYSQVRIEFVSDNIDTSEETAYSTLILIDTIEEA